MVLFLSCAALVPTITRAQDQNVAGAARQERVHKQQHHKRTKHVYTEEDLKRLRILTPEDRAALEAKRNECLQKNNCSPAPSQNPPAALDANSQTQGIPLGDVARQYRKQKELQALKPKQSAPFHLPYSDPALASPVLPERSAIHPPAQPAIRSKAPSNVFRRDPFAAAPARPRGPGGARPDSHGNVQEDGQAHVRQNDHGDVREDVRPTARPQDHAGVLENVRPMIRPRTGLVAPAQPRVFSRTAPPNISVQPVQPTILAKPAQPVVREAIRPATPQLSLPSITAAAQKTLSVQRGDSLWKLAQENLGSGNRWPELVAANSWITDPNQIRAGAQLHLPVTVATSDSNRKAGSNATTTIRVHKGDTLWTLAKANLGRSSYWPCLAAANPSVADPNHIYENQELSIPTSCRTVANGSHSSR